MKYRLLSCVDIVLSGLASNIPNDDDDDNNDDDAYDDDNDDDTNTNNNDENACKIPFFLL